MRACACALAVLLLAGSAHGFDPYAEEDESAVPSFLPHFHADRFWFSGQANVIFQGKPPFDARYSGPNSLSLKHR